MGLYLYDSLGYEIRLETTKTYNPKKAGVNEDARDVGVFVHYLGAVAPGHASITYEDDPYVFSRLEFPFSTDWNYQAVKDSWLPEFNGLWTTASTTVYLKDMGIRTSGLKIIYYVPAGQADNNTFFNIYINQELVKSIRLSAEGTYIEILDVSEVGKEQQEYLDKAHRILKTLLAEFDRVCKKYDLRYYLICGSLIGAVRHQDLVPWDDDIDVAMPRKDFDILLKHVEDEWGQKKDFLFLNYDKMGNHSFLDYMTRIVYMKEEIPVNIYRKIRGKGRADVDNHLPIDIYVLDNASNNELFHKMQTQFIRGLYGLAMGHRAYIDPADYENRDETTQKIVKVLSSIGKFIPVSWIFGCYEWVRKWNKNKRCDNYFESNGFIYCIPWKFRQEWFAEGVKLPLGDMMVSVPRNYDAFLNMHYGNYMQYPPIEARKPTHSIEASGIF